LTPLLDSSSITHAETTRNGRNGTIPFVFDPSSNDAEPYARLPAAAYVLNTFPLKGKGQSTHLRAMYCSVSKHEGREEAQWIQLGSTGIWQVQEQPLWIDRHSKYGTENARAVAEDELLAFGGCVLNLSGLWGGEREPRNWIGRVAGSKDALGGKGSLHLVHGVDVARASVAVVGDFTAGERWVSALFCMYWASKGELT
jgi:hypothetical protein